MNKNLLDIFRRFNEIIHSYDGEKTDWEFYYNLLNKLLRECYDLKIPHTENAVFYQWTKIKLQEDISKEIQRLKEKL